MRFKKKKKSQAATEVLCTRQMNCSVNKQNDIRICNWIRSSTCFPVVVVCQGLQLALRYHRLFCANLCLLYFRFDEIAKKNNVEYHAGGSTQNSVKIAQVSLCLPCLPTYTSVCPKLKICQAGSSGNREHSCTACWHITALGVVNSSDLSWKEEGGVDP